VAFWETLRGYGLFSHELPTDALIAVQFLVAILSVMSLTIAATIQDRDKVAGEREKLLEALSSRAAELARANSQLQLFSSAASHDLQEPLRTLILYLQLLDRRYASSLPGEGKEFLDHCQKTSRRMQSVIESVLRYTKGSSQTEEFRRVSAGELVTDVLHNLHGTIEANRAQVTVGPLPEITVQPQRIFQLLQNLIGNAIKFRTAEDPRIHMSASQHETDWLFEVKDNGIGIPAAHREAIFSPFKRLHDESEYAGTGVGLALCKHLVETSGGSIWVKANPTGGSIFYFTLPAEPPALKLEASYQLT